jgi:hypothetical protein
MSVDVSEALASAKTDGRLEKEEKTGELGGCSGTSEG